MNLEEMVNRVDWSVHPKLGLFIPEPGREHRKMIEQFGWTEMVAHTRREARGNFPIYAGLTLCQEVEDGALVWASIGIKHMEHGMRARSIFAVAAPGFDALSIMSEMTGMLVQMYKRRDQEKEKNQ